MAFRNKSVTVIVVYTNNGDNKVTILDGFLFK